MNSVTSKLSALAPANGANAIASVAFAIEIDALPDPSLVSAFAALAPLLAAEGFGPPQPMHTFTMAVGPSAPSTSTQEIGGYRYIKSGPGGQLLREFSLQRNALIASAYDYTRWQAIWGDVHKLYLHCASMLEASSRIVRNVALQYTDKFTWRQPHSPFPVKDVLRSDNKYFAAAGLDETGDWHSNFGFLAKLPPGTPWAVSRIDNVNLSVVKEGEFSSLTILSIYRYQSAAPTAKQPPDFISTVFPTLCNLVHDSNKDMLKSVLTDDVCRMISLS